MIGLKLFCLLNVLCSARCSPQPPGTFPIWSEHYTVEGTISHNFPAISERFKSWYDYEFGKSRIDYNNGTTKTFHNEHLYGSAIKISLDITETGTYNEKCFQVNGSEQSLIWMQSTLPKLDNFKLENTIFTSGKEVEEWTFTSIEGKIKSVYMMSLYKKNNISYPLDFQMNKFLLKVNYELVDDFFIVYTNFSPERPNQKVFQYNASNCEHFSEPSVDYDYTFQPMMEIINNEYSYDYLEPLFQEFKNVFNKTFTNTLHYKHGSISENLVRKIYFHQNVRYIYWKNRATVGYNLAINHLAADSDDERNLMYSKEITSEFTHLNGGMPFSYNKTDFEQLPNEFDWIAKGAVTLVKNQSMCGAGWSFATAGAIEGAYFLKYGKLKNFSVQALKDCTWEYGNMGCTGGLDSLAYPWIKTHGIPTEEEYGPYDYNKDGMCLMETIPKDHLLKISGFVNVTALDEESLKIALVRNGPIAITIHGSLKSFAFYAGGVYDDNDCSDHPSQLNHGALLVGYGTLKNQPYWLVKNSWTNLWGDSGYAMISRKKNLCGIMTRPTYVNL